VDYIEHVIVRITPTHDNFTDKTRSSNGTSGTIKESLPLPAECLALIL